MKTFKQFQEAIALAPLAIPASKMIGAGLAATGLTGMVLQSKKKKSKEDGLPLDKLTFHHKRFLQQKLAY